MNKNLENYKKAVDEIHVDSNLKDKTLEKAKNISKKKYGWVKKITAVAALFAIGAVGVGFYYKTKDEAFKNPEENYIIDKEEEEETLSNSLVKKFSSMDELREKIKESQINRNL